MSYKGSVSRSLNRLKRTKEKVDKGLCIKCNKPHNTEYQLCFKCGEERRKSRRKKLKNGKRK